MNKDNIKHLVVHRRDIGRLLKNPETPVDVRYEAITALQKIKEILREPDSIIYDFDDLSGVTGHFNPGEKVVLYGAF